MTTPNDDFDRNSNNATNNNQTNHHNRRNNAFHSSSNGMEIRLLMTSRDAGAVIGKGGSSIQKLRAEHPQTIIQVPDCASPERILIINGDPEQTFDGLTQIIPLLTDSSRFSAFSRRRINFDADPSIKENQHEHFCEIRFLVHQIYCGAIIGKGGQHVKELRQKHDLDIKVFSRCCPASHERVIAFRGKVENIVSCIRDIYSLMKTSWQQPRGPVLPQYHPRNFDIYSVDQYGGFQPPNHINHNFGFNPRSAFIPSGPRGLGVYPIQSLAPLVDVPYGGGPGLNARYPPAALFTSTRVTLPNELVGAVIGQRGTKIQQIRHMTNANIIIDDQPIPTGPSGADRIITIEGTPEQISRAQALLQQAVRQSGLWRP